MGERTPPCGTPVLNLWMCGFCMLCGFASLDVVCDELYDCAWNEGIGVLGA